MTNDVDVVDLEPAASRLADQIGARIATRVCCATSVHAAPERTGAVGRGGRRRRPGARRASICEHLVRRPRRARARGRRRHVEVVLVGERRGRRAATSSTSRETHAGDASDSEYSSPPTSRSSGKPGEARRGRSQSRSRARERARLPESADEASTRSAGARGTRSCPPRPRRAARRARVEAVAAHRAEREHCVDHLAPAPPRVSPVKNGSRSRRSLTSSVTGQSPARPPKRSAHRREVQRQVVEHREDPALAQVRDQPRARLERRQQQVEHVERLLAVLRHDRQRDAVLRAPSRASAVVVALPDRARALAWIALARLELGERNAASMSDGR